jgi:hypothetical protein
MLSTIRLRKCDDGYKRLKKYSIFKDLRFSRFRKRSSSKFKEGNLSALLEILST